MKQIIVGVDAHKSSHIAVAINTQGARLGGLTIPTTSQGMVIPNDGHKPRALSKRSGSKEPDRMAQVFPECCKPKATQSLR